MKIYNKNWRRQLKRDLTCEILLLCMKQCCDKTSSSVRKKIKFSTSSWPFFYSWYFRFQKQPFADVLQNRCLQIHRKTPVAESFLNKVASLQDATFIYGKRAQCPILIAFPMLRTHKLTNLAFIHLGRGIFLVLWTSKPMNSKLYSIE